MGQACGCEPKPKEDSAPAGENQATPALSSDSVPPGSKVIDIPKEADKPPTPAEPPVEMVEETKMAVLGGGVKSGKVEIMAEAAFVAAPNDPNSVTARKSIKKDKSGDKFDGKRKEYVYDYINKEGGYIIDPSNKKSVIKIEPGCLN